MKKKLSIWIYFPFLIMGILLLLTISCKKEDNSNSAGPLPVLTTVVVTNITNTTASCGGNITSDGGTTVTARGVCWSTSQTPTVVNSKTTDGTGKGSFTSNISGLTASTTYYVRAYATNSAGTVYGSAIAFTTPGTVTDINGNIYSTVTIGNQVWMAVNLKTTKFNDGSAIPLVTDNSTWEILTTPGYCWYNNSGSTYAQAYGALYNYYTVYNNKLCPTGWHVPTDADWTTLITYLGGENVAGGKLKESGTTHWNSPNSEVTNETGFTALPGGCRNPAGTFVGIGGSGNWWSATQTSACNAWSWNMIYNYSDVSRLEGPKHFGLSVRCMRD